MDTQPLGTAKRTARRVVQQEGTRPLRQEPPVAPVAPLASASSVDHLDTRIRSRAFELYEQRGAQDGQAQDDWLQAERELLTFQSAAIR
ncbi:MAG: DUF2934 domain-containing protein [Nitrospiraceae bacterium]